MFCTNCGKELDDSSVFCIYCGTSLQQEEGIKPVLEGGGQSTIIIEGELYKLKRKKWIPLIIVVIIILIVGVSIVLYSNTPDKRLIRQLSLGEKYLEAMDYEQAVAVFEKALEIDPKNKDVLKGIARAYVGIGDNANGFDEAFAAYNQAIIYYYREAEAYLKLADLLITAEKYEEAMKVLDKGNEKLEERKYLEAIDEMEQEIAERAGTTKSDNHENAANKDEETNEDQDMETASGSITDSEREVVEEASKEEIFIERELPLGNAQMQELTNIITEIFDANFLYNYGRGDGPQNYVLETDEELMNFFYNFMNDYHLTSDIIVFQKEDLDRMLNAMVGKTVRSYSGASIVNSSVLTLEGNVYTLYGSDRGEEWPACKIDTVIQISSQDVVIKGSVYYDYTDDVANVYEFRAKGYLNEDNQYSGITLTDMEYSKNGF